MGEVVRLPVAAPLTTTADAFERFRVAWQEAERRPCIHTYREAVNTYDLYCAAEMKAGSEAKP